MKKHYPKQDSMGLIPALIATAKDVISHGKFNKCETNRERYLGHLLIFYGFIAAMATAGLALFFTIILENIGSPFFLTSPINFPNPIKILGIVSGIALIWGSWILIKRRLNEKDEVGSSGYHDWLFLIVIFSVGLTGMLSYLLRIIGIPILGYVDYYVHLILVFFLLWYAPYSKFGHMFYRTLALTYAKSTGIDNPRKK
jgi:quinone-modifying oxidoreductase subunit QmoC